MAKWSDKYKKSIDCSNPKGFSQKAHCAGRKKKKMNENAAQQAAIAISKKKSGNYDKDGLRKTKYKSKNHPLKKTNKQRLKYMKEAGRPYSKTYLDLLIKSGQGKTANTVNVKIPKSGHFMDEEKLNEKGVFTTLGRVAGQYMGDKIGAQAAGASAGEALGVQTDYHTQKAGRTAKARFTKFRRGVKRKGYKPGDLTRAMVNKPRKPQPERKEPTLKKERVENIDERNVVSSTLSKTMAKMSPTYGMAKKELKTRLKKDPKKSKMSHAVTVAKKYTGVDTKTLHDITENGPCWDTHKQVGMKMKNGRRVPNCVPKNEDAPVNAVGGGNIAGLGIGPQGEPGIPKKRGRKFRKLMPFILYMKRRQNV